MISAAPSPLEDRIVALLHHLGLPRAHFAARGAPQLGRLPFRYPEVVASLAVICPQPVGLDGLGAWSGRLLCLHGCENPRVGQVAQELARHGATVEVLEEYRDWFWSDVVRDRPDIGDRLLAFLDRMDTVEGVPPLTAPRGEGEVAGITYHVEGAGPPLLLLPLGLAPSQWASVLPRLATRYTTLLLGGAHLNPVADLVTRADSGYASMVLGIVEQAGLRAGQTLLEVGCGPGALLRHLVVYLGPASAVVDLDINPFLLREAAGFARREGWADQVAFREGSAEDLPFPNDSFDTVLCSTVIEEVDADRALAEMVRVARPGGSIVVVVRAVDRRMWIQVPVQPALQHTVEGLELGGGVTDQGCADASLYRRLATAGLASVRALPQLMTADLQSVFGQTLARRVLAGMTEADAEEWRTAVARAKQDGLPAWIALPFHCALGMKSV